MNYKFYKIIIYYIFIFHEILLHFWATLVDPYYSWFFSYLWCCREFSIYSPIDLKRIHLLGKNAFKTIWEKQFLFL